MERNQVFWSKFATSFWEKKPGVFKNLPLPIFAIDAKAIFTLLVQYSDFCRKAQSVEGLKFYLRGQRQFDDQTLEVLPRKEDKSLAGYHRRMSEEFSDYCLVCDELVQVAGKQWHVLSDFMQGLYSQVGVPNRYAEIGLYLGNYRKTPFGVHVDGCGVLSVPVVGAKKFRLWKPEYVEQNPELKEAHSYPEFKKGSSLLKARPGELTYWPSSYWHIAESDGSFNATWSIGVWVDQPFSEVVAATIKPLLTEKLGEAGRATSLKSREMIHGNGEISELPEDLESAASLLGNLSQTELRDVFLKHWIETLSRRGFKSAPRKAKGDKLKLTDRLVRGGTNPIAWASLASREICIGAGGALLIVPDSPSIREILATLNAGDVLKLATLKSRPARSLIRFLHEFRAVEKR